MRKGIIALGAALVFAGAGCAEHHAYYRTRAEPVVVSTPPPPVITVPAPVVVAAVNEQQAAQIARAEAFHHGWRNAGVNQVEYLGDRWHVDIYNQVHKHGELYGWVDVAPNGQVLSFSDRPRHHVAWYREHRYRY